MAGILQLRRGTPNISLSDGEAYLNQASSSLQIGSGSATITLVPLDKLITGDIRLSGNIYANNITGSSTLQAQIITNQTVGALSSGTTLSVGTSLETIFNQMLVTYIPVTLGTPTLKFSASNISTAAREVGQSVSISSVSFTTTAANPGGLFAVSASYTLSGTSTSDVVDVSLPGTLSSTNNLSFASTITDAPTAAGNVSFTLKVRRPDNNAVISANASTLSWRFRSWFLASPTLITNSTTFYAATGSAAANVVDTALNTGKSWTVSCTSANNNGSNYTYIIYPSSYGNLSGVVQDGATPVLGAFLSGTSPIDVTILNQYGRTQTIRIYRSNAFGAFSDGTSLAIS